MKKAKLIIYVLIAIFLMTGCNNKKENIDDNQDKKDTLQTISIERKLNCKDELTLYYTDSSNNKYYTMCLNRIILKYNEKEIELKDALGENLEIMDEVINKLTIKDVIYDGGTKLYEDNENIGFKVIKCNSMYTDLESEMVVKYNNDYYFGDENLEYKDGYCKYEN